MSAIKRTDTAPERSFRSLLHRSGYRFRKDLRFTVSGRALRPDVVFTKKRIAIFIDGCFWHSCPIHGRNPTTNSNYWAPKLLRTVERDNAANQTLVEAGWSVLRIWEHVPVAEAITEFEHVFDSTPSPASSSTTVRGHLVVVG